MKTFVKPIALLGLVAGALTAGVAASQARDATQFTGANTANYYVNGANAYEAAPAYVAASSVAASSNARVQSRGFESYAYAPHSFGEPVRASNGVVAQQRHLNGTE